MDMHLELSRTAPLRPQLEHALRESIRSGRLVGGTKLPPTRTLAADLGISRGVAVETYEQLVAEGYLVARRGDGTRVARTMTAPAARNVTPPNGAVRARYNLLTGTPDLNAFPRNEWAAAITRALRELPGPQLGYAPSVGLIALREQLVAYLGRARAVVTDPEHLVVTCGCTHGMSMLWHVLRAAGATRIAIEDPCWNFVHKTLINAGLEPVPIAVDEDGLQVDALDQTDVSAVVISPAHQYPIGSALSPERRGALITWARTHDAFIVEDDYDAEFRYDRDPIGALQGLAPDRVAYLGSVSKTIAPGLSLGWMALPAKVASEVSTLVDGPRAIPSAPIQAAYATLLGAGSIDRHLRRMRRTYRRRRDTLITALSTSLPACRISGTAAGLHLLVWLCPELDSAVEEPLGAACAREGVAVDTLHARCAITHQLPAAMILGYGQIDPTAIPNAAHAIGRAVNKITESI